MAAMTSRARCSMSVMLFAVACTPVSATMIPTYHAQLTDTERTQVARLACPQSAGRATAVRAGSYHKGSAKPDFADVTCAPVKLPSGVLIVATNECELSAETWKCERPARFVEYTRAGRTVHLPIEDLHEIPARLELAKYLLSIGLYQGYSIWDNVGGGWCRIENAPHGDLGVACGAIEMVITNDAESGPPKYRMFAVAPGPIP